MPKLSGEEALLDKLVLIHQQDIADPIPQVSHPTPLLTPPAQRAATSCPALQWPVRMKQLCIQAVRNCTCMWYVASNRGTVRSIWTEQGRMVTILISVTHACKYNTSVSCKCNMTVTRECNPGSSFSWGSHAWHSAALVHSCCTMQAEPQDRADPKRTRTVDTVIQSCRTRACVVWVSITLTLALTTCLNAHQFPG